ncbi:formate--tetrahydrofolate ligase [Sporomusa acidovorans]|uniref:Formate--tetrahydrofolate ligase n=1 Tax=Sporomusa acidovorans (strain ATCC 49682 / DSM 3132 / Mol) TaxID=1123286 RepID=A0ABZ3J2J6_SPOA4|nr:formate--tetrahydrofolate ligase [Sporomusa acidovorans]OZC14667.1 formate--tetrahydrofolate ligase [Sporomusa acidovorans DSM 3132]SDF85838.1 Formate--tetrahydrofolate ligase [Sporomusa acidovorans]
MKSDVGIIQESEIHSGVKITKELGISAEELELYESYKAKVSLIGWERIKNRSDGKRILASTIRRKENDRQQMWRFVTEIR